MSVPVKVIIFGLGVVGLKQVFPLIEKGADIVGAIDVNPNYVGKDLAEIAGLPKNIGVTVTNDAETLLTEITADIVLLNIFTEIERMAPFVEQCLNHGVSVITACDELNYPWAIAPGLAQRLDDLAKASGVAVAGTGLGDALMVNAVATFAAACSQLSEVRIETSSALNHVGLEDIRRMGVGLAPVLVAEQLMHAGDMTGKRTNLEALACVLGLEIVELRSSAEPIISDQIVNSEAHDLSVAVGKVVGVHSQLVVKTKENIDIVGSVKFSLKPHAETNKGYNVNLKISGDVDIVSHIENIKPTLPVSNQLVNRIPDVLNANPGLLALSDLPRPSYRSKPLESYI